MGRARACTVHTAEYGQIGDEMVKVEAARQPFTTSAPWLIMDGMAALNPIKIHDYPAVKRYLDSHWEDIKSRSDQGDTSYNLRGCALVRKSIKFFLIPFHLCNPCAGALM